MDRMKAGAHGGDTRTVETRILRQPCNPKSAFQRRPGQRHPLSGDFLSDKKLALHIRRPWGMIVIETFRKGLADSRKTNMGNPTGPLPRPVDVGRMSATGPRPPLSLILLSAIVISACLWFIALNLATFAPRYYLFAYLATLAKIVAIVVIPPSLFLAIAQYWSTFHRSASAAFASAIVFSGVTGLLLLFLV